MQDKISLLRNFVAVFVLVGTIFSCATPQAQQDVEKDAKDDGSIPENIVFYLNPLTGFRRDVSASTKDSIDKVLDGIQLDEKSESELENALKLAVVTDQAEFVQRVLPQALRVTKKLNQIKSIVALNEIRSGRIYRARLILEQIENEKVSAETLNLRGLLFAKQNRISEAQDFFRKAYERSDRNLAYGLNFGICLLRTGSSEQAFEHFKKLDQIHGGSPEVKLHYGVSSAFRGRHKTAMKKYQEVLQIEPNNLLAQYNLALTQMNLKQEKQALATVKEGIAMSEKNDIVLNMFYKLESEFESKIAR